MDPIDRLHDGVLTAALHLLGRDEPHLPSKGPAATLTSENTL